MPLYMDFHKFPAITIQDAKNAHVADQSVQDKYGVIYHHYWVNESAGTVFCLVEGPDKGTCEKVHQTSHGHIACALVEVDRTHYELIMGNSTVDRWGLVHHDNGTVDEGYRSVIGITIGSEAITANRFDEYQKSVNNARELVVNEIAKSNGRNVGIMSDASLFGVFNDAKKALQCAYQIQRKLNAEKNPIFSFGIGLSAGQPVTENDPFFEETMRLAKCLCRIANRKQIVTSSLIHALCESEVGNGKNILKSISKSEEVFITSLFNTIEIHLADDKFSIDHLVRDLGMSRPQLYRKTIALTGKSPSNLIRDLRLSKAFALLRRKEGNISEIALEVGFSSPSYFSKCFADRFGYTPSKFLKVHLYQKT